MFVNEKQHKKSIKLNESIIRVDQTPLISLTILCVLINNIRDKSH